MKRISKFLLLLSTVIVLFAFCKKSTTDKVEPVINSPANVSATPVTALRHPGITLNKAELDQIKAEVKAGIQPRKAGWDKMISAPEASLNYKDHSRAEVDADGGTSGGFSNDAGAVLSQALHWYVTGNEAHALKCIEMMNNWSGKLTRIYTTNSYPLQKNLVAAWTAANFAEAAEIIRYTYKGWLQKDQDSYETMMSTIFYPLLIRAQLVCTDNGAGCQFLGAKNLRTSNQECSWVKAQMAVAVLLDDKAKFNDAAARYKSFLPAFIDPSGEANETCRDAGHTMMGLAELAQCAEIAFKQGVDLYSELPDAATGMPRLAMGFEVFSACIY